MHDKNSESIDDVIVERKSGSIYHSHLTEYLS